VPHLTDGKQFYLVPAGLDAYNLTFFRAHDIHAEQNFDGIYCHGDILQPTSGFCELTGIEGTAGSFTLQPSINSEVHLGPNTKGAFVTAQANLTVTYVIQDDNAIVGAGNCNSTNSYCIASQNWLVYLGGLNGAFLGPAAANGGTGGINFSTAGGHINGGNKDVAGTCAFASGTTCSIAYSTSFNNIPVVVLTPVNPGSISFTLTSSNSSGFTITASVSNSLAVNYVAIGNPN